MMMFWNKKMEVKEEPQYEQPPLNEIYTTSQIREIFNRIINITMCVDVRGHYGAAEIADRCGYSIGTVKHFIPIFERIGILTKNIDDGTYMISRTKPDGILTKL